MFNVIKIVTLHWYANRNDKLIVHSFIGIARMSRFKVHILYVVTALWQSYREFTAWRSFERKLLHQLAYDCLYHHDSTVRSDTTS